MKYTFLLILFLFSLGSVRASDTAPETKPNSSVARNNDLSVLTSKAFITSSHDEYQLQIGAFKSKANAESLVNDVKAHLENEAIILFEDGYYKVRLKGLPKLKSSNGTAAFDGQFVTKSVDPVKPSGHAIVTPVSQTPVVTGVSLSEPVNPPANYSIEEAKDDVTHIFFLKGDSPWLKKINFHGKSFVFVNALIIAIILSITMMIALLVFILMNRTRMEKEERLKQYLMEKYQGLIIDYLFGNASPEEFKAIASDNYRRQVLIDQMIDVSVNLKGDEGKKLVSLYKHLGLDRDSIERAYDSRWHKKIKGFRELAFMGIRDANSVILNALNSPNQILRMEAQIALVRLSEGNPFEFLSHLKSHFSLWEQITLHELIILHNIPLPEFKQWLNAANPSVVMFALRMIREFKQLDCDDQIRAVLQHQNDSVRFLAVQVAGDLKMASTFETMKHMYKNQPDNICLEIVKSMGKMADISMIGFLQLVLDKEDDVQLQIEATKAIQNIGEEGVNSLVNLMKSEYKNYSIIIRHVLDRRIY